MDSGQVKFGISKKSYTIMFHGNYFNKIGLSEIVIFV